MALPGEYQANVFGGDFTAPDWMNAPAKTVWESLYGGTGGIGEAVQDPADIYSQFAARFRQPQQQALYGAYSPLLAQYQLQRLGTGGMGTSFTDFLGTGGVRPSYSPQSLWELARTAGTYGAMSPEASAASLQAAAGTVTDEDLARRAYAQQVYGSSPQAGANQLAIAQMLAMRNPAASSGQFGFYGGDVGQAIQQGMENLQRGFRARGGDEREFLNFLLGAMSPAYQGLQVNPAAVQNGNGA